MDISKHEQAKKEVESVDVPENSEDELTGAAAGVAETESVKSKSTAIWEQDVRTADPIASRRSVFADADLAETPQIETPASLRDKYTFIKEIGHGTQGRVYLAENKADHFKVAIKQLVIESVSNWKAYELFQREAAILSTLKIRGVARFYEAIECLEDSPACSYIVQEYIPGQSLNDMLKTGHRFSLDRVYDIILQLLGIIGKLWIHDPPVIHRDIKPSNILLKPLEGDEYLVYLIDFGAVANPQVQSGGSTVAGTFGYMPPEQLMGKPVKQSDIYSLAAVAVYLITGRPPADMPVKDYHLMFEPDMQNMPPVLVQTLRGMLEPNVDDRLCDIQELCERFLDFSKAVYNRQMTGAVDSLTDEAYAERLKNVQYYGQDGNVELWQRLPDQTPRNIDRFPIDLNIKPLETFDFLPRTSDLWEKVNSGGFGGLILAGFVLFCFTVYLLKITNGNLISLSLFIGYIVVCICIFVFHLIKPRLKWLKHGNGKPMMPRYQAFIESQTLKYELGELKYLLAHGRKTIATIVNIKYIRTDSGNVEEIPPEEAFELMKSRVSLCERTCHGCPCFEIDYKFNPPDDMREEDLVHKIIAHCEPENHYQVGDPFPILYMIRAANEKEIQERVISMPFPFPMADPVLYTDILYGDAVKRLVHSLGEKRKRHDATKDNVYEVLEYLKNAPHVKYGDWNQSGEQSEGYDGIQFSSSSLESDSSSKRQANNPGS